jgi:hypothetical protein
MRNELADAVRAGFDVVVLEDVARGGASGGVVDSVEELDIGDAESGPGWAAVAAATVDGVVTASVAVAVTVAATVAAVRRNWVMAICFVALNLRRCGGLSGNGNGNGVMIIAGQSDCPCNCP